ncbi:GntR family transcriptional regulator [Mobilicoccus caccae]|nr:GntR family transcriptional regulator [Mobilicoccus caccae]
MSPVTSDPADLHAPASLAESLRDTIRRQIVTTVLHPGDLLLEKSLAAEFGVSKTPVREALQMLVVEGWITLIPRRGYAVSSMGFNDIREVMHLRQILEPAAASAAAAATSPDLRADLEGLLEEQISAPTAPQAVDAAHRFHRRIAVAARNKRALRILESLWAETARAHRLLPPLATYIGADSERSAHRDVLDAIGAGDPERAGAVMAAHLAEAEAEMVRAFYR